MSHQSKPTYNYVKIKYAKLFNYLFSHNLFVNYICDVNNNGVQVYKTGLHVHKISLQMYYTNIQLINMTKPFYFNNPLSCRWSAEEHQLLNEQFGEMFPELEPGGDTTNRVILNAVFARAFAKYQKNDEPRKVDQENIESLTNEIGRLKISVDLKDEEIVRIQKLYHDADENNQALTEALHNQPLAVHQPLGENEFLLNIPPIIQKILDIEVVTAKKKTGKDFSIVDILLNSFWDSVKIGRVSPYRQWSSGELSNLAKQLISEQK